MKNNNHTSSAKRYSTGSGFTDLLFNLLLGFILLFIIAFLLIQPPAKQKIIDPKAEFVITMTWPNNDSNDIDLWVRNEKGMVSFRAKSNKIMHLDHDDLGQTNDTVVINGETFKNPHNTEVVSIRQIVPGKYTINVHWYQKKGNNPLATVPVTVEIMKINPFRTVASRIVILEEPGQEQTAFSFVVIDAGGVVDIETTQEYWVTEFLAKSDAPRPRRVIP